jgi:hypothetical protein
MRARIKTRGGSVGPLKLKPRTLQDEPTGFHDNRVERWSVHKSAANMATADQKESQIYLLKPS